MRKLAYLVTLALVLTMLVAPSAGAMGYSTGKVVYIKDFYFSPASISVQPGTTVTWINAGQVPHTVTADSGQFDSGVLMPGDSYTVKFFGHGTLSYFCEIHPEMRGIVGVGVVPTPVADGGGSYSPMMGGQHMSMGGGY